MATVSSVSDFNSLYLGHLGLRPRTAALPRPRLRHGGRGAGGAGLQQRLPGAGPSVQILVMPVDDAVSEVAGEEADGKLVRKRYLISRTRKPSLVFTVVDTKSSSEHYTVLYCSITF